MADRAVRPEAFAVERHPLDADHAGVADEHLQLPVALQVAQLHVGDAAVGVLQGVLRIVGHRFQFSSSTWQRCCNQKKATT